MYLCHRCKSHWVFLAFMLKVAKWNLDVQVDGCCSCLFVLFTWRENSWKLPFWVPPRKLFPFFYVWPEKACLTLSLSWMMPVCSNVPSHSSFTWSPIRWPRGSRRTSCCGWSRCRTSSATSCPGCRRSTSPGKALDQRLISKDQNWALLSFSWNKSFFYAEHLGLSCRGSGWEGQPLIGAQRT